MRLPIFLLLIILVSHISSNPFTTKCFSFTSSHGVSNSISIAELFRVTVGDCLNYCIINAAKMGDGCVSVVYHKLHSTCQLYGHNGYFNGSKVVPANAHDFYQRTSWTGFCQDKVVPKRAYKQRPLQYALPQESHQQVNIPPLNNFVELQRNQQPITTVVSTTAETSATAAPTFLDEIDQHPFEEISNTISFLNPTHNSECSKREKLAYFVVFGYRLSLRNLVAELKGIDQSSCVMYCSQNINAKGEAIRCYSLSYEPVEEKCFLHGKRASLNRHVAHLAADSNFFFADKFCIQTKKDCSAESPFIVYPFKQMHKQIITSYPGMNSVVACVANCIDTKNCKAVTYKVGLCILHSSSPASDSSLIVDGDEQTMIVENGCQLTAETLPSFLSNNLEGGNDKEAQWEEWGPCQFGAGGRIVRVRQRKCNKCEDLRLQPC